MDTLRMHPCALGSRGFGQTSVPIPASVLFQRRYSGRFETDGAIAMLDPTVCRQARLARDARFDGLFFTAVKTTRIYCRCICPAVAPKEENVVYYPRAIAAAQAGYRPCLRCRPDSAPGSAAWKGANTTFERALSLIDAGALEHDSLEHLASRLGISTRYLRQRFQQHLGVSPKTYALYKQCLFAKQLLHETQLPITEVAHASGFKSLRRFNDCFQSQMTLTPSALRKTSAQTAISEKLQLQLHYRPPYHWPAMQMFFSKRLIAPMEWCGEHYYGRNFELGTCRGHFTARHRPEENAFQIEIHLSDSAMLKAVVYTIRRLLDLDADSATIDTHLKPYCRALNFVEGLRIPGTWNLFEAGVRAICGQQVSVAAARKLVEKFVRDGAGREQNNDGFFPSPQTALSRCISQLPMPRSRKETLQHLAQYCLENPSCQDPEQWLSIKGIGRWTIDYAKLRGLSEPDIYLGGDLGIKKALQRSGQSRPPDTVSPWQSYLSLQLWNQH